MNWFETLPPGSRVLLAENRSGIELLDWLAEPENRKRFATRLAGMPSAKPPIPTERLNALLDGWLGFRAWLGEMTAGRNRRLEALAQNFAPRKPEQALIEAAASGESERIFADVEANGDAAVAHPHVGSQTRTVDETALAQDRAPEVADIDPGAHWQHAAARGLDRPVETTAPGVGENPSK
jgi:hypothetical protein